jgi:hypothetical protein
MKKHNGEPRFSLILLWFLLLVPVLGLLPKSSPAEGVAVAATKRYLPLLMKPGTPPGPATRLVIFEAFMNPS